MTTNAHILASIDRIGTAKYIVRSLVESDEKQQIVDLLDEICDHLCSAQTDFAAQTAQIAELTRQIYEPMVQAQAGDSCRFIDADAVSKGLYTVAEFERMLRQACESNSKVLGTFLRKYEKIGYLDFHGESKKKIFEHLRASFPTMRPYKYTNFTANF